MGSEMCIRDRRRIIIVTPFVNQQFRLQVVERGRAVQSGIVEQFTSGEDVTPSPGLLPEAQHFLATIWPLIEILRSLVIMDLRDIGCGPNFFNLLTPGDLIIRLVCIKHTKHNSTHLDKHFEGSFVKIGSFVPEILDFTFPLSHFLGHSG